MLPMATVIWVSYILWLLHNQVTALLNRATSEKANARKAMCPARLVTHRTAI